MLSMQIHGDKDTDADTYGDLEQHNAIMYAADWVCAGYARL